MMTFSYYTPLKYYFLLSTQVSLLITLSYTYSFYASFLAHYLLHIIFLYLNHSCLRMFLLVYVYILLSCIAPFLVCLYILHFIHSKQLPSARIFYHLALSIVFMFTHRYYYTYLSFDIYLLIPKEYSALIQQP